MTETRDTIAKWAEDTFGAGSDSGRIARALEELSEAADCWQAHDTLVELADVTICLCACPSSDGIDVPATVGHRLWDAVEAKMVINRARKWVRRGDGNGDHVKDALHPAQQDGWQDIATAPKDGSEFTGYELVNDRPRILSMVYDSVCKGFVASVHSFVEFKPTHWRPLPAPPANGAQQ